MHVFRNIHDRLESLPNQPRARNSAVHVEKLLGTLERDTESTRYVAPLSTHIASPEDRARHYRQIAVICKQPCFSSLLPGKDRLFSQPVGSAAKTSLPSTNACTTAASYAPGLSYLAAKFSTAIAVGYRPRLNVAVK